VLRSCRNKEQQNFYNCSLLDYALELQKEEQLPCGTRRPCNMGKKDYDVVSRLATKKRKLDSYERTARTSFGNFLTEDIRNASTGRFTDDRKRPKMPLNEQEMIQKMTILQLKQQLVDNNIL
jgi:hypothetical protein